jgi:aspartate/methionine/tyrosine aminotransferase
MISGMPVSATLRINEEVARRRAAGEEICHMGFGESPFPVHPRIIQALRDNAGFNQYSPTLGDPDLRRAALAYFPKRLGFSGEQMDVLVGPGSKDVIFAAQLAIEGDLLLPTPSWVSYAPQARLAGNQAIRIPTRASNHHKLTGAMITETVEKARASGLNPRKLILNYPNNPTGLGLEPRDLEDIAETCREAGLIVISDEIYSLVSHGAPHQSIAALYPEGTIVTTGLSKHLSLGGYRVGLAFVPDALDGLLQGMAVVASETWSCVSNPIQRASITALEEHDDIEEFIALCTRAHGMASNYMRDELIKTGIEYLPLAGAFYLYPDFSRFADRLRRDYGVSTSTGLALDLLARVAVATLPGRDFGEEEDVLTLRLAITDYDGTAALDFLRREPDGDPVKFVETACPRVAKAAEILNGYFAGA